MAQLAWLSPWQKRERLGWIRGSEKGKRDCCQRLWYDTIVVAIGLFQPLSTSTKLDKILWVLFCFNFIKTVAESMMFSQFLCSFIHIF